MLRRHRPRILAAVKATPASDYAFRWACHLARHMHADLLALYVHEIPMEFSLETVGRPGNVQAGEEVLHRVEALAEEERCRVAASMVAARNAGPAIVLEASERAADLLVLGIPHQTWEPSVAVGSATDYILKNASCQVVVCRQPTTGHGEVQD